MYDPILRKSALRFQHVEETPLIILSCPPFGSKWHKNIFHPCCVYCYLFVCPWSLLKVSQ